ncbi:hypothetical protein [Actinokineospora inagensis]|uniref:hypothetical protein n=1 Tax=Actinokineospora inagensis TaxID=103730 RepID=UPI001FE23CCC|nr:hypothetical protein [Actinokineospora inagensis]
MLVVVGSLLRAPLPMSVRWGVVGAVVVVVGLTEVGVLKIRLPENRRLVPEGVFRLGRHLGPLQFGIEMGTGARTYLPSGLPYVAAAVALFIASFPQALLIGVGFGVGRAVMTTAHLRYPGDWDLQWARYSTRLAVLLSGTFLVSLLGVVLAS